jgi:hypothetical protein
LIDNWQEGDDPYGKGQALFLRSLNYFNLVRLFGGVPLHTTMNASIEEMTSVKRSSLTETYDFILNDLRTIIDKNLLPVVWTTDNKGRATIWAAHTLLANVYLNLASPGTHYTGNKSEFWKKASEHALIVKDKSSHSLEADYKRLWQTAYEYTSREVIFDLGANGLNYNQGGVPGRFYRSYEPIDKAGFTGWGNNIPSWQLYNAFDNLDYRKETGFLTYFIAKDTVKNRTSNVSGLTKTFAPGDTVRYDFWIPNHIKRPHLRKFFYDPGPVFNYDANVDGINFKIYRFAEVLLMIAEAENEVNKAPTLKAYDAINLIRRRAYKQPLSVSGPFDAPPNLGYKEFQELVRSERRKELHQEAKRWFDLVRWDVYIEVMSKLGKNVQDYHRYFPIPQREMDKNPNIEQNMGY